MFHHTRIQVAIALNLFSLTILTDFYCKKLVLINIHEYTNELIHIFEYLVQEEYLSFYLVPTLLL